jgi:hypothetical protein
LPAPAPGAVDVGAVYYGDPACTSLAAGYRIGMSEDMLLPKAEVQYVAEVPLDKSTVNNSRPRPPFGFRFGRLRHRRARNDLMFRCSEQFCNIEPKICQHD